LLGVLNHYLFRKVWENVKAILTDEEMKILLAWGRAQAQKMGLTSPEEMPN
jgi:hypothetical protein